MLLISLVRADYLLHQSNSNDSHVNKTDIIVTHATHVCATSTLSQRLGSIAEPKFAMAMGHLLVGL